MTPKVAKQVDALRDMTVAELREEYAEVCGEETRSRHKEYLRNRIAWRLQASEDGGLSERALRRAEELARNANLRLTGPSHTVIGPFRPSHDRRPPMPGTTITRGYRGQEVAVTVLDDGFEYCGQVYRSLTAVAKAIPGTHWNGFHFFFGPNSKGADAGHARPPGDALASPR